ncbi:MAG TPA: hypothetical protein VE871_16530 [Longimicrobium sp.]|nr:hypothetical protein [Longimicrobium sp.]
MPAEPTSRDLYLAVSALEERHRDEGRTLEAYLLALWSLARPLCHQPSLSFDVFVRILDEAHTAASPPFDEAWRALTDGAEEPTDWTIWEQVILHQIRDLREMEEAGTMEDEYRWFGVKAPRGMPWYNLVPAGYLEGAVAGTFGGWEPEDGGRVAVPGPVAVMGDDGEIHMVDPSDDDDPVVPLSEVTWEAFTDFLRNGQWYE